MLNMLGYDHGNMAFPGKITTTKSSINLGAKSTIGRFDQGPVERGSAALPWGDLDMTSCWNAPHFHSKEAAGNICKLAPKEGPDIGPRQAGADITVVQGVNDSKLPQVHKIRLKTRSCTTNCLRPIAAVASTRPSAHQALAS